MAYTTDDLEQIRSAKLTGAKRVKFADGRETEFRSLDELDRIEREIVDALNPSTPRSFSTVVSHSRD
jgi:hypothetical protein